MPVLTSAINHTGITNESCGYSCESYDLRFVCPVSQPSSWVFSWHVDVIPFHSCNKGKNNMNFWIATDSKIRSWMEKGLSTLAIMLLCWEMHYHFNSLQCLYRWFMNSQDKLGCMWNTKLMKSWVSALGSFEWILQWTDLWNKTAWRLTTQ